MNILASLTLRYAETRGCELPYKMQKCEIISYHMVSTVRQRQLSVTVLYRL